MLAYIRLHYTICIICEFFISHSTGSLPSSLDYIFNMYIITNVFCKSVKLFYCSTIFHTICKRAYNCNISIYITFSCILSTLNANIHIIPLSCRFTVLNFRTPCVSLYTFYILLCSLARYSHFRVHRINGI